MNIALESQTYILLLHVIHEHSLLIYCYFKLYFASFLLWNNDTVRLSQEGCMMNTNSLYFVTNVCKRDIDRLTSTVIYLIIFLPSS